MKIKRALCLLFVLVLIGATAAFASVDGEEIEVFLNNSKISFNGALPYISSGGVAMVPLRKIANELGLEVAWSENSSQTVTVTGGKTIEFNLSGKAARVNGTAEYLPEKPQIIDNKAYVPLRFLCETLMLDVEFSAPNRVYLAKKENEPSGVKERPLNTEQYENNEEVNVLDFGADPTGVKECTSDIKRAHNTGKRVYYPNGTYRFNGANLNLSGGVRFESKDGVIVHNDISNEPILNFDDFGNFVGLQQGHLEKYSASDTVPIRDGNIVSPPLSETEYDVKADFLVHWYNDFGLEFTRQRASAWKGWYYWTWNYHNAGAASSDPYAIYDPERHPMLGYYRGDDPKILDWQCYWLKEYGVKGAVLYTTDYTDWEKPEALAHWIYELFEETPNFKKLKYVMTMHINYIKKGADLAAEQEKIRNGWREVIEKTYFAHKENVYLMDINGKKYPAVYIHEEMAVPGVFDNYEGAKNAAKFYKEMADWFKEEGFDGVAIFARHFDERFDPEDEELRKAGVWRFNAKYEGGYASGYTYDEMLEKQAWPNAENYILNVFTGADTHDPHPSKWRHPGHAPEKFEKLLGNAVEQLYKENSQLPKVITCYNMAEWAEGGPGLQPNMKNGFAYLEAIKNVIVKNSENN